MPEAGAWPERQLAAGQPCAPALEEAVHCTGPPGPVAVQCSAVRCCKAANGVTRAPKPLSLPKSDQLRPAAGFAISSAPPEIFTSRLPMLWSELNTATSPPPTSPSERTALPYIWVSIRRRGDLTRTLCAAIPSRRRRRRCLLLSEASPTRWMRKLWPLARLALLCRRRMRMLPASGDSELGHAIHTISSHWAER